MHCYLRDVKHSKQYIHKCEWLYDNLNSREHLNASLSYTQLLFSAFLQVRHSKHYYVNHTMLLCFCLSGVNA